MAQANIKAVITADDRASKTLKGFGDRISGTAKSAAIAAGVAGAAIVAFGVSSVKAFAESQDVMAQTNAVLKSTGKAAGVTANQVTELATSLQSVTKFNDEAIQSGQNLLLTFTKIGKDVFPDATKIMLDMSQALGQDVKASAIQVGKALQDPILGVTALRRVGVNFSESQKEVIKKLVETGKSAEAQKLILKELQTEFGGSAIAAGDTFSGKLERLKNTFGDLQERIGEVLVNALTPLAVQLAEFVKSDTFQQWVTKLTTWLQTNLPLAIAWLKDEGFPFLKKVIEGLTPVVQMLWVVIKGTISYINENRWVITALAAAFVTVKTAMFLNGALKAFKGVMAGVRMSFLVTKALITTPMIMPAIAVAAALAAIVLVYNKIQETKRLMADVEKGSERMEASNRDAREKLIWLRDNGTPAQKKRAKHALSKRSFAAGTNFAPGGLSLVGERGPEMVQLPRGSKVTPANETAKIKSSSTINLNVNIGMFAGSPAERRKIAETLLGDLKVIASKQNTSVGSLLA